MKKPYIFITRKIPAEAAKKLYEQFEVNMWDSEDKPVPRDILLQEAKRADALMTMLSDKVDEELLMHAPNLKVVANLAVGYDNIDMAAADEKSIVVCNTPEVLTDTTADLAFILMMAAARRIVEAAEVVKKGEWKSWSPMLLAGHDIHHKTIGIFGMGSIGETVAKRATGFDMEILYHNRSRKPHAEEKLGANYVSFEELIEKSDFIVCLSPLTKETYHKFDADAFSRMKKSAVFVNAARGPVIDEAALLEALQTGEIAAAGLDVFDKEPIGADHPLLTLPNVIALPHIGSASTETRMKMTELCVENIELVLLGKKPKTAVNK